MGKKYAWIAADNSLGKEIQSMQDKLKSQFGLTPQYANKKNATKIIAWKSKHYNIPLTKTKLWEILMTNDN